MLTRPAWCDTFWYPQQVGNMTNEQRRAYQKAWRAKNRERLKQYRDEWREANREKLNAYARARYKSTDRKEYRRAYYAKNKTRIRALHRGYYEAHKDYWRGKTRGYARTAQLKKYGLTYAAYDAILADQHGVCAICQRPERPRKEKPMRLAVDHHHKTGKVRGLLCRSCNTAIAILDDADLLAKAAAYIRRTT